MNRAGAEENAQSGEVSRNSFDRFVDFARRIVAVPKKEIDKKKRDFHRRGNNRIQNSK